MISQKAKVVPHLVVILKSVSLLWLKKRNLTEKILVLLYVNAY